MSYESFASYYDILTENVEYEKIAAALDTSPANVYNIKKRALAKLTVIVLNDGGYEK